MNKVYVEKKTLKGRRLFIRLLYMRLELGLFMNELSEIKDDQVEQAKDCRDRLFAFLKFFKLPQEEELDENLPKDEHIESQNNINIIFSYIFRINQILEREVFK